MAKFLDFTGLTKYTTKVKAWAEGLFLKKSDYDAPTIKVVKLNGSPLSPDGSKAVNIDLSTYALKDAVSQEIAQAVSGIKSFEAQVVDQLPESGKNGILYLVKNSGSGNNTYDEFLWVVDKFEMLGTRQIDLSGYALKTEIPKNVSQLTNDSGFQTASNVTDALKPYAKTADVPTKVSELTNDSGFISSIPAEYVTDSELTSKGYQTAANVTAALAPYAKKTDLPTAITTSEIDSLFS